MIEYPVKRGPYLAIKNNELIDELETSKSALENKIKELDDTIIAVTAHAMQGDRQEFIDSGIDDYIPKPVNAQELSKTIQSVMRKT